MKKLYLLCLVTLAAVFMDIVFFHSRTVSAQNTQVQIQQALVRNGLAFVNAPGSIVGFACFPTAGGDSQCFIASRQ